MQIEELKKISQQFIDGECSMDSFVDSIEFFLSDGGIEDLHNLAKLISEDKGA